MCFQPSFLSPIWSLSASEYFCVRKLYFPVNTSVCFFYNLLSFLIRDNQNLKFLHWAPIFIRLHVLRILQGDVERSGRGGGGWGGGSVIFLSGHDFCVSRNTSKNGIFHFFFPSLRAGGILQILQCNWFRERGIFYDLAR